MGECSLVYFKPQRRGDALGCSLFIISCYHVQPCGTRSPRPALLSLVTPSRYAFRPLPLARRSMYAELMNTIDSEASHGLVDFVHQRMDR